MDAKMFYDVPCSSFSGGKKASLRRLGRAVWRHWLSWL